MKRLNEAIASDSGYNAVGFSYGGDDEYDPMNPTEDETGRDNPGGKKDGMGGGSVPPNEGGYNAVGFSYGSSDEYDPVNPEGGETGKNNPSTD